MSRSYAMACLASAFLATVGFGCSCQRETPAERAAVPIVEQNVAARGGLEAWRAVQSLTMSGLMDAGKVSDPAQVARTLQKAARGTSPQKLQALLAKAEKDNAQLVQLPFTMELERPRKSRVEVQFNGQTAVQVYDGTHGWKLRPFLGRHEVEAYTAEEQQEASEQQDLDGPLIDHAAKGNTVELDGKEQVEGRDTYKLKVTLKGGQVRHVWVDAQTYLEVKSEGAPRRLDGKEHAVETYFHDYRSVDGLMIPYVLETRVEGVEGSQNITIQRVALNPELDASRFAKPE